MPDRTIVEAAARLRRQGEPYLIATLVAAHGAAARPPGTRLVLTQFRWIASSATGGCLAGEFAREAWSQTRDRGPLLIAYDARAARAADEELRAAFGLDGDGVVEVLVERAGVAGRIDALEFSERCLRTQRRGAVTTIYRSDVPGIRTGARLALAAGGEIQEEADPIEPALRDWIAADMRDAIATGAPVHRTYATSAAAGGGTGHISVWIEPVLPPPQLFLFGAGHDAVPLAHLARQLGWDVVVCASEPRHATSARFAGEALVIDRSDAAARIADSDRAVAVLVNHDAERDRDDLAMLLETNINYIAVPGSRARALRMLEILGVDGDDPRVHAAIGGDGARAPLELAVAIAAELQAGLARTLAARVRQRPRDTVDERPRSASVRLSRVPQPQSWIDSARS